MYLLMMSLLLCRQRGEGVRKLAKSCRRHLWTAPRGNMLTKIPKVQAYSFKTLDVRALGLHFPTPS